MLIWLGLVGTDGYMVSPLATKTLDLAATIAGHVTPHEANVATAILP